MGRGRTPPAPYVCVMACVESKHRHFRFASAVYKANRQAVRWASSVEAGPQSRAAGRPGSGPG